MVVCLRLGGRHFHLNDRLLLTNGGHLPLHASVGGRYTAVDFGGLRSLDRGLRLLFGKGGATERRSLTARCRRRRLRTVGVDDLYFSPRDSRMRDDVVGLSTQLSISLERILLLLVFDRRRGIDVQRTVNSMQQQSQTYMQRIYNYTYIHKMRVKSHTVGLSQTTKLIRPAFPQNVSLRCRPTHKVCATYIFP